MRASLLLRISVSSEQSTSLVRQEQELRALAEREGFVVVAVHADDGVSGAAKVRPAFAAWLRDASEGRADVLLAWDWSRISREGLVGVSRVLGALEESGARLLTLRDRVDSASPAFELIAAVMASTAKAERQAIRERVLSRQRHDRAEGRWTKGAPWAYTVDSGTLVPIPDRVALLRVIVDRYMAGSLRGVAAWLNDEAVPAPRGGAWGVSSVRYLLRSPLLFGALPHAGGWVRDELGEPVLVAEPVLSFAEWRRLQDRLDEAGASARGRRSPLSNPLRGHVFCPHCGGPLSLSARDGVLRCQRSAMKPGACVGYRIRYERARADVVDRLLAYLGSLDPESDEAVRVADRWLAVTVPERSAEIRAAEAAVLEAEAALSDLEAARYERGEFDGDRGHARWAPMHARAATRYEAAVSALAALDRPSVDLGALFDAAQVADAVKDDDALADLLGCVVPLALEE